MASSPSNSPVWTTGPIGVLTAGLLALLAVAGIWSTGAASEGRPAAAWTAADTVTFARDVAPIL